MMRLALGLLASLAACTTAPPHGGVAVGPEGASGQVRTGRVAVGAGPGGASASAKVIDTDAADVTVGTGGASVAVAPGGGPFRVILGPGGVGLGF